MKRRLQVFISSTFTDLLHERQAAVGAILKAGHIPAGMELFTAGDKSQMVTIKQWIDDSDVYMLILGGRYGSIEPASGFSYTELEYDYASQQRKPIFAVVITDAALEAKVKVNGTAHMEKENPKELALFRKKVLSNISSFFEDPKDIKLCVHESLADFAANRDLRGWVSADEIQDTKPLFDEIRKLSDENRELKETISALEKKASAARSSTSEKSEGTFAELRQVLGAIEVKIPAKLADGKEAVASLLTLFYGNKETLVNGVTNATNSSEAESFFFFDVCPKLQVHGLVESEKVPGARYRRCAVSSQGRAFLADMERRMLLTKKETASSSTTGTSPPDEKALDVQLAIPSKPKKMAARKAPAR